jgi:hypothetical protein
MESVTMDKGTLQTILAETKASYLEAYKELCEEFQKNTIDTLQKALDKVEAGGKPDRQYSFQIPADHSSDYDRALSMLGHEVAATVTLSKEEYTCMVLNEWGWMDSFRSSYTSNTGKAYGGIRG